MNDEKVIGLLSADLATDGHSLGGDVRAWSDDDLVGLSNLVNHWRFQITRELTRRATCPERGIGDHDCIEHAPSDPLNSPLAAEQSSVVRGHGLGHLSGSEDVKRLLAALDNLVDTEPCGSFDHHGNCQEHMATVRGKCAHATAKELLAELNRRADEHTEECR